MIDLNQLSQDVGRLQGQVDLLVKVTVGIAIAVASDVALKVVRLANTAACSAKTIPAAAARVVRSYRKKSSKT